MAKFVANTAVDMTDLFDLGLLSDWNQLNVPNTIVGASSFTVSTGPVKLVLGGFGLTVLGADPVGGFVQSIIARESGIQVYKLSNLNYALINIENTFSGSFEGAVFQHDDTINGSGSNDILYGYKGADTIVAKSGNDLVKGGAGADTIGGKNGNDSLQGDKGPDTLNGGAGLDTMAGGKGADIFEFSSAVNGFNVGVVTDFNRSQGDEFDLARSNFAGIGHKGALNSDKFIVGTNAGTAENVIVYNKTIGALYYDSDGSGVQTQILFATVTAGLTLKAGDFFVI